MGKRIGPKVVSTKKYLNSENRMCPFCKSERVKRTRFIDFPPNGVGQDMKCLDCKRTWIDQYERTGFCTGYGKIGNVVFDTDGPYINGKKVTHQELVRMSQTPESIQREREINAKYGKKCA